MDAKFRHRRKNRNLAIAFIPGFLAWAALNLFVFVVMAHPNANRLAAAVMMGGLPLVMAGLSLWSLIAYWREELTIRDGRIIFRGVVRQKEIDLSELTEARWRYRSGCLVLRGAATRITIHFSNYEDEDRDRLIGLLRSTLRPEVQTDWALFAYKVVFREPRSTPRKPGPDEVLLRRDSFDRYLVIWLVLASLAGIVGWRSTGQPRFLVALLLPLVAWAVPRAVIPTQEVIATKLSASVASGGPFLRFGLLWGSAGIAALIALVAFRGRLAHPEAVSIVGGVIWFGGLLFEAHKEDRGRRRRDREAAELAAKARGERIDDLSTTD